MKIRKFNEAQTEEFDSDYVKTCFADLLDAGAQVEEKESDTDKKWLSIKIDFNNIDRLGEFGGVNREFISRRNKLGDFINKWDSNNKILQKVKISMNLLSEEYPNYKVYSSQLTNTTLQINIYGESWY
jgi:hypothetical protein